MSAELQYINDTILIEKLAEEQLKFCYGQIYKQAGVLETLGGVAETIKNTVKQQFDEGGVVGGIANIMAPSILFRLHPIAGILYLIGTTFGFDITSVYTKIMQALKPKLESGKLTLNEVNEIGKNVVAQEAGPIEATSSNNMLYHLNSLYKNSQLADIAKGLVNIDSNTIPNVPWLLPEKQSGPIQRIFGELLQTRQRGKAKWLLGGFVVWIIKTMLSGAGLLAGAAAISSYLKPKQEHISENKPATIVSDEKIEPHINESAATIPEEKKLFLKPSGRGQQIFANDSKNLWIVPLINQNIEDTLWAWAIDVYPDLYDYQSEIINSPSFQRVAEMLQINWKTSSPSKLVMPQGMTNRKQVVDLFADETQNIINKRIV